MSNLKVISDNPQVRPVAELVTSSERDRLIQNLPVDQEVVITMTQSIRRQRIETHEQRQEVARAQQSVHLQVAKMGAFVIAVVVIALAVL